MPRAGAAPSESRRRRSPAASSPWTVSAATRTVRNPRAGPPGSVARGHRRHRRRQRRTDATRVVVGDPRRESHDVRRQVRLGIQDFDDRLDGRRRRLFDVRALDDAAGQDPAAERHEHTGPDDGRWKVTGKAVGQTVERGHRDRDANEAHSDRLAACGDSFEERAHFLHVLPDITLAVRAAQQERGMKGRDERRAAVVERAAAQARDRVLGLQAAPWPQTFPARR